MAVFLECTVCMHVVLFQTDYIRVHCRRCIASTNGCGPHPQLCRHTHSHFLVKQANSEKMQEDIMKVNAGNGWTFVVTRKLV